MTKEATLNWIKIKKKLRKDRKFFFEFILGHYIKTDGINQLHSEWFDLLSTERKLGIIAPRGHAKSTIINIADNLFDICNGYEPYIVIFSDTPEQATEHLGAMVEELEGNERILEFYRSEGDHDDFEKCFFWTTGSSGLVISGATLGAANSCLAKLFQGVIIQTCFTRFYWGR